MFFRQSGEATTRSTIGVGSRHAVNNGTRQTPQNVIRIRSGFILTVNLRFYTSGGVIRLGGGTCVGVGQRFLPSHIIVSHREIDATCGYLCRATNRTISISDT